MEGHALQPSERIPDLQEYLARWSPRIHPVKSAEEEFQENLKKDQALLTDLSQNSLDKLSEIVSCATRMQQLKALHDDTKDEKEREYQQKLWEQQEALAFELFDLFGLELIKQLCKNWCDRRGQSLSTAPTEPDTTSCAIDTEPKGTTTSRFTPIPDQPTSTNKPPANSTKNSMPTPPNTENVQEPSTRPIEPDTTEHNTSAGPQKRPAEPPAARPTKRSRPDVTQGPLTGDRTIEYDQVYQNGQAEPKYVIAEYNGFWYILECKAHRMHFNNHPIRGAAKHLRGKKHNQPSVNYEEAVRALGTRVLGCDEGKAKKNNDVARRPCYSQMGRPVASLSPSVGRSIPTRSNESPTGIDPKPGEVYTTFWSKTKEFFAILVLPWLNTGQLGNDLTLTVKDTGLIKEVPFCYQYNETDGSVEWAPEYRPDGQHYNEREYPIMYFDASVFPGECRVNWVAAREFAHYDPKVATIPFKEIVDGFIASRNNSVQETGHHTQENEQGALSIDAATAEIFPREQPSGAREIIVIDDDNDDDTGDHYQCANTTIGSEDRVPKTEPPDEPMRGVHEQEATSTTCDNAASQQPFTVPIRDDTQLFHGLPGPQSPNGDAYPGWPTSCDTQAEIPNYVSPQWPPFLHGPSAIANTYFHPQHLSQPTPTDTRAPEAIMAPLPLDQSPSAPSHDSSSQMQPTAKPCQDAELYTYFNQARNASSQFQLDSDGQLRWIAPKTPSAVATKQKPMSARQHEELRARILPTCKEPQPTQHKAPMPDSHQTSYVTPHGFKRSF
ncbi:uncharacterized protein B0J16DRAFT_370098 [Fusarium flagelliforme]|uniref:uncharacterized protein n=1 Tax=Fusarium flagelliforme TaxID=2675880 RepID=UPI001E8CB040|nr:uncharacterized protein B0J16DRAFT_370098 [Fusarium flagelliforme]KAH7188092.1 hypothetical protein B0J16DRAFT_370098 [Fusarium flagelliforme]